jgi:hypothetical protein
METGGKLWRHGCGYPLRATVRGRVGDAVVVEYRDGRVGGVSLPLYHCPKCGKPLSLWWPVERGRNNCIQWENIEGG